MESCRGCTHTRHDLIKQLELIGVKITGNLGGPFDFP